MSYEDCHYNVQNSSISLCTGLWEGDQRTFVSGMAFKGNIFKYTTEIYSEFKDLTSHDEIVSKASELNGLYGVVHQTPDAVHLVADHLASRLLFYSTADEHIRVSTNAADLASSDYSFNETSVIEFTTSLCVREGRTLVDSISKIKPGTVVSIGKDGEITTTAHHTYHSDLGDYTPTDEGYEGWKKTLLECHRRLLTVADDRPIVIGLTGGYDSRLIALMLKHLGYDNVITYTYNLTDQMSDSKLASELADGLGYEWIELEISHDDIKRHFQTDRWRRSMRKYAVGGVIDPSPATLAIFEKLEAESQIPEDGVHIEGHHAAGPGGSVPYEIGTAESALRKSEVIEQIINSHCTQGPLTDRQRDKLRKRLEDTVQTGKSVDPDEAFEVLEKQYWMNRVPFVLMKRSQQTHLSLQPWYPLLDREYVGFWRSTPHDHRFQKQVYKEYVSRFHEEMHPESAQNMEGQTLVEASGTEPLYHRVRSSMVGELVKQSPLRPYAKKIRDWVIDDKECSIKTYSRNPTYAILSESEFKEQYSGSESAAHFLSKEVLNYVRAGYQSVREENNFGEKGSGGSQDCGDFNRQI